MAITTLDGVIAGAQFPQFFFKSASGTVAAGRAFSYWYKSGIPGAATIPTGSTMAGDPLTAPVSGQIPYTNPTSPEASYLARLAAVSGAQGGTIILADRLWHNYGINMTSTSPQTVNSATWPARDLDQSTDGRGIFIGVEVLTATGAASPTITVSYTNSAGASGRIGTNVIATNGISAVPGTFYQIALEQDDQGVRSIQTITLSASWLSGTAQLVAYRPIAAIMAPAAGVSSALDALTGGMPLVFDNSVPYVMLLPATNTSTPLSGNVTFTHG